MGQTKVTWDSISLWFPPQLYNSKTRNMPIWFGLTSHIQCLTTLFAALIKLKLDRSEDNIW